MEEGCFSLNKRECFTGEAVNGDASYCAVDRNSGMGHVAAFSVTQSRSAEAS